MQVDPKGLDLPTLVQIAAGYLNAEILKRLADAGFSDLRTGHGYVFQRLVDRPATVGDIAQSLGFTHQAASLAVVELEELGYVRREVDLADRRVRRVSLTERGRAAIDTARRVRAELTRELADKMGAGRVEAVREALVSVIEMAGGLEEIAGRRVRPIA